MEPAAVLAVVVKAQGVAATNAQLKSVQANLQKTEAAGAAMATGMKRHGTTAVTAGKAMTKGFTVPLLAIGTASVLLSRQFGGSMRLISTQAGASRKEMEKMKHAVLELSSSGKVKQSPKELADALFHIESVGFRGSKALEVLKSSADLATLGQSDMEATTYAMVSALETGIKGTETLGKTMGTMNAIVGAGDLRMEDFTKSLSSGVLVTAKQVGLSLTDVGAALDVFTARGVPAQVAATRLRMTFTLMASPTDKAKEALKGIGLDSEALAKKMQGPEGLIGAIKLLREHMDGLTKIEKTQLLTQAFGGAKSGTTIMGLVGGLGDLEDRFHHIEDTTDNVKQKLKEAKSTPGFKMDAAVAKLEASLIKLGDQIMPVIVPVIEQFATVISGLGTAFAMLPEDTQKWVVVLGILLAVLGPLITIYGKMFILGGRFLAWLVSSTVATEAATVANAELAASMQAVTAAQSELLIANSSGAVVGSRAVGIGAAAAPAGASAASGLAMGLKRVLPFALAAVGIGNILSSVVKGDTKGAIWKTGGAIAGGIAGGMIGGLPGAMIGAGLGTFGGQILEGLFGSSTMEKQTIDYFKRAKRALDGVSTSGEKIAKMHHRQKSMAEEVQGAESKLANVRQRFGPHSAAALDTEAKLIHKRRILKRLNQEIKTQEMWTHGPEKAAAEIGLRKDVPHMAGQQARLVAKRKEQRWELSNVVANFKAGFASYDLVRRKQNELADTTRKLKVRTKQLGETFKEAREKLGNKFAKSLQELAKKSRQLSQEKNPIAKWFNFKIRAPKIADVIATQMAKTKTLTKSNVQDLIKIINGFPKGSRGAIKNTILQMLREWAQGHPKLEQQVQKLYTQLAQDSSWKKQQNSANKTKQSYEKAKRSAGSFRDEMHIKMPQAATDVRNFSKTAIKGIDKVGETLGGFASELGIKGVKFGAHSKGKEGGKKQRGGPITVPGGGTGDTVPLMAHVEPGEVIHVLNSRASKDRSKLAALEQMNSAVPRFATGGTLGTMHGYKGLSGDTDFFPAMGFALSKMASGTGTHINVASGYRSVAEQAALYALYLSGKGNLAAAPSPNAPHVRGYAADIAPDRGTFGGVAGNYGLGFTVPSEAWHIELLNAAAGAKGMFAGQVPKMPGMTFSGPQGLLSSVGQATLDSATKMAQQFLNQHVGAGGVGTVATGPVVQMAKQMVSNMWGTGQWGPFNLLEMSEAGWDYTAVNPSSGAGGLAQALPPSKYPPGAWPPSGLESAKIQLEWMMGYIKDRYTDPAGAWAFHQANNWYQKGGSLGKNIHNVVTGLRKGKHLPKYKAMLKRVKRKIGGIGLDDKRLGKLTTTSKEAERFSEYASNASSLTTQDEEGTVTQGLFKGQNESAWLNMQLGSLLRLRNQVVGAHGAIEGHQLPRVDKMIKDAKARLRAVQKAIREAEEQKRKIEKKIKEIEQAQKKSKQAVEKEVGELENNLQKAQGAKHPNKQQIEAMREQIKTKKDTMSGSDKQVQESIKKMNEEVDKITKQNKARSRGETALKDAIIPSLTEKQAGLHETLKSLYDEGGEVGKYSFMGLQGVQGSGGPTGSIPEPPPIGELSGEVFTVQNRLREIGEEAAKVKKETPDDSESADLAKEIASEWQKKYMVSQAQYATLQAFPGVQQATTMPYAGSFAKGGVMMAEVGERGREVAAFPQGTRIIPKHEADSALSNSGNTTLVIEELTIYEDGTAQITTQDGSFDAKVRKVNRKQAGGAAKSSPGSRRMNR
jgi:TP901 family phage tail tape measure protein